MATTDDRLQAMETADERFELLDQAAEQIHGAVEAIRQALDGTGLESNAEAYIIGHLINWADGVNPYDDGIPQLKENIVRMQEDLANEAAAMAEDE